MKKTVNIEKLIEFRNQKGLTQREMADILGIATITYSQKEQGLINVTLNDLVKLKKHFKINVDALIEA